MIEQKNDIIKKYKYNNYVIYIKETENTLESYLQNEKYGIINLMFGVSKEQNTLEELLEIVKDNIDNDIKHYKKSYEDED